VWSKFTHREADRLRVARFAGECVDDRDADRDEGEALPVGR
jgi:hypothetical protein